MDTKTVLVVVDDKSIRKQLERELKRNFFRTSLAASAKEALEIFSKEEIDILLLDIKLPDIDGLEVLEKVKERKPDCEVIVIAGFETMEIAIQSLKRGALDYIEKPIKTEELSTALGRAQERLVKKEGLSYKHTLLVIDDEEELAKRLKVFLEKEGYNAFSAYNGREGLNIIENNRVEVVITDIEMVDMDGIEVLQRTKRMYPDIEVIIITGYTDHELAIKSLRAGAIDYITKPVNLDELLFSIKKAIERSILNRNRLFRNRELKISAEIISKLNEELERRIEQRTKELTQSQTQLFQTSKLATLGEMSAGVAHEMNQPLGAILLSARYLRKLIERRKLSKEEIEASLEEIEDSVKRMSRIIQHIRIFARQDTLDFVQVEVNKTIDSALSLLGEQLRLHEIEVVQDLSPGLPQIIGEPYQLEQVWINLIANARDAVDEKGKQISDGRLQITDYKKSINISTIYNPESEIVEVHVSDNGIGMSKEEKEKVLEPFFTTKEVGAALGLGLSISYRIILGHKGKIEVESKENEGATIRVILPIGG